LKLWRAAPVNESMKSLMGLAFVALTIWAPAARAGAEWLHVEVRESDWRSASVVVNLPMSSLTRALPLLPESRLRGCRLRIGPAGISEQQLRGLIAGLVSTGSASCDCDGQRISAVVEGGSVRFDVRESRGEDQVSARLPLSVVQALGSGTGPGLDYLAALNVVAALGGGELALVTADRAVVRIWLDDLAVPPTRP
jgi:hypothetical protein